MANPSMPLADALRHRTPILLQSEAAECGLACLLMVAGHHGRHLDMTSARQRFTISINGMTLADIIDVGRELGMASRGLSLDLDELKLLRLPCILHWDHSHFVVLVRVDAKGIVIHDPAAGRRTIPFAEVGKRFTGVALEAWPDLSFEKRDERRSISVLDLVKRTSGLGRAAIQILAISALLEMVGIAMPFAFQIVLDEVIVVADRDLLLTVVIGLAGLLFLQAMLGFIRAWSTLVLSSTLSLQWKAGLFDRLMQLPLGFFEKRHVGDIVSRFDSLDQIQQTLTARVLMAVLDGVMALALLAVMIAYGGWLVLIVAVSVTLYVLLRVATYPAYRSRSEQAIHNAARESSHFLESIRGISSLKALCLEHRRKETWINHLVARIAADVRVRKLDAIFATLSGCLLGGDRILLIYFGAAAVMANSMTVGMLIAFLSYRDQFTQRIAGLIDAMMIARMLSLHGERISDIALAVPEKGPSSLEASGSAMAVRESTNVHLSLKNVSFRYGDNEAFILNDFSMDVREGECIGIAGPSGAGKSTLLKIAAGLNEPTSGNVLFNGASVASMGLAVYRRNVACVLQNDRLFTGSIAQNIAGFADKVDMERVEECARLAAIHEEILSFPMGYETFVGDMGSSLSGGQTQRVIIARALYRSPKILIMDEATSHLDNENEARINNSIRALKITRILVAHRQTSLDVADRVVHLTRASE